MGKWTTFYLGDHCRIRTGKKDVNEGCLTGQYPFFTCSRKFTWSDEYSFDTEAILIAGNGEVGNLHYYKGKFEAYQRTYVLDNFDVNIDYIYQYLGAFLLSSLENEKVGTSIPYIKLNNLYNFKVDLPVATAEQVKISTILKKIDQAIQKTETLIQKYQQIKAGLMHDLFTRGVTADGKLRPPREEAPELYQETPVGRIPKEWRIDTISNLFNIQLGKMLSRAAKTGKCNALYLGNKNVQWDRVELDNLEQMDFTPAQREKYKLVYGDLLICEGGDVGRTALWQEELENCFYQKAIHRLRSIDGKVYPSFMLRFMRYAKVTGFFTNFTSQTSIAHLTQEQLSKVKTFIPPTVEQSKIIKKFDCSDNIIRLELDYLEKLKKQKAALMHDLLTGKIQVSAKEEETENV